MTRLSWLAAIFGLTRWLILRNVRVVTWFVMCTVVTALVLPILGLRQGAGRGCFMHLGCLTVVGIVCSGEM